MVSKVIINTHTHTYLHTLDFLLSHFSNYSVHSPVRKCDKTLLVDSLVCFVDFMPLTWEQCLLKFSFSEWNLPQSLTLASDSHRMCSYTQPSDHVICNWYITLFKCLY